MRAATFVLSIASMFTEQAVASLYQSNIEELTDTDFSLKMGPADKMWLVTFYAPWDQNAAVFSPILEDAAQDLINEDYHIKFGAVDVSVNTKIGYQYSIDSSPTVKLFYND